MAMKNMKTLGVLRLYSGRVRLSAEQIKPRRHLIKEIDAKNGIYEIVHGVTFKAGETLGYEGDIPKSIANIVADAKSGETFAEIAAKNKKAAAEKAAAAE